MNFSIVNRRQDLTRDSRLVARICARRVKLYADNLPVALILKLKTIVQVGSNFQPTRGYHLNYNRMRYCSGMSLCWWRHHHLCYLFHLILTCRLKGKPLCTGR